VNRGGSGRRRWLEGWRGEERGESESTRVVASWRCGDMAAAAAFETARCRVRRKRKAASTSQCREQMARACGLSSTSFAEQLTGCHDAPPTLCFSRCRVAARPLAAGFRKLRQHDRVARAKAPAARASRAGVRVHAKKSDEMMEANANANDSVDWLNPGNYSYRNGRPSQSMAVPFR
jgi:hypothetical protein